VHPLLDLRVAIAELLARVGNRGPSCNSSEANVCRI